MPVIDKLAWVQIERNALLVARSRHQAAYYLPGGKREAGEQDQAALIREIREELSVELLPETVVFLEQFEAPAHGQAAGTTVRLRCYTAAYQGELQPAAEIEEMTWLPYADRHRASAAAQGVMDYLLAAGWLKA
jgi:8-oxo-dGTP pyrophosphatase MutT (NUDIX family)